MEAIRRKKVKEIKEGDLKQLMLASLSTLNTMQTPKKKLSRRELSKSANTCETMVLTKPTKRKASKNQCRLCYSRSVMWNINCLWIIWYSTYLSNVNKRFIICKYTSYQYEANCRVSVHSCNCLSWPIFLLVTTKEQQSMLCQLHYSAPAQRCMVVPQTIIRTILTSVCN